MIVVQHPHRPTDQAAVSSAHFMPHANDQQSECEYLARLLIPTNHPPPLESIIYSRSCCTIATAKVISEDAPRKGDNS